MDTLIEDYERKVKTISRMLEEETNEETINRLKIKRGCYNTFIAELKRENEWKSMDTAPKDGTKILVKESDGGVYLVSWMNSAEGMGVRANHMKWCIPESYQDEQGGYFDLDDPIGWRKVEGLNDKGNEFATRLIVPFSLVEGEYLDENGTVISQEFLLSKPHVIEEENGYLFL